MKGRHGMTLKEKVEEIRKAVESGVPKRRIGIGGNGAAVRKLLKGEEVASEIIEEIYANLQSYRENPNERRARREKYRDSHPTVSKGEKAKAIKNAVQSGVAKGKLDPFGGGDAVRKLMKDKPIGDVKINEMYANLLAIDESLKIESEHCTKSSTLQTQETQKASAIVPQKEGKAQRKAAQKTQKSPVSHESKSKKVLGAREEKATVSPTKERKTKEKSRKVSGQKEQASESDGQLHKKVLQQEKQIAELTAKVTHLEETVREITEFMGSNKRRPIKVLGITVTQKTDKVGDKKYRRWYGIYRGVDGKAKARWIYIGKDVTRAEEKIKAWLEKNERKQ